MKTLSPEEQIKLQEASSGATASIVGEKYTESQLKEFAVGVFKDHPNEPAFYVDEYGTFKNSVQYKALKEADKENFVKLFNPNVKAVPAVDVEAAELIKELSSDNRDALGRISTLNQSLADANAKASTQDVLLKAANDKVAELEAQLNEAKAQIADLSKPADAKKKKGE